MECQKAIVAVTRSDENINSLFTDKNMINLIYFNIPGVLIVLHILLNFKTYF